MQSSEDMPQLRATSINLPRPRFERGLAKCGRNVFWPWWVELGGRERQAPKTQGR